MNELLCHHFLTIIKGHVRTRVYYNVLRVESTINKRIKFMAGYKNKFSEHELKGLFEAMIGKDSIELSDVLLKHFRKCGQEYEIKLIIPK